MSDGSIPPGSMIPNLAVDTNRKEKIDIEIGTRTDSDFSLPKILQDLDYDYVEDNLKKKQSGEGRIFGALFEDEEEPENRLKNSIFDDGWQRDIVLMVRLPDTDLKNCLVGGIEAVVNLSFCFTAEPAKRAVMCGLLLLPISKYILGFILQAQMCFIAFLGILVFHERHAWFHQSFHH
ncbi:hypothetical protein Droror1_Dr00027983, partial [Drosera rotundifolia]